MCVRTFSEGQVDLVEFNGEYKEVYINPQVWGSRNCEFELMGTLIFFTGAVLCRVPKPGLGTP